MLSTANEIMLAALQAITPILGTSVLCLLIAALLFAAYRVLTIVANKLTQRLINLSSLHTVQSVYHQHRQKRIKDGWIYSVPTETFADDQGNVWTLTDSGNVELTPVKDIHDGRINGAGERVQAFRLTGVRKPSAPETPC
ncbi:MAG: hypothetical protein AWU57_608 [Marinobacter sp. T13-3]|nr:MAG: hypothetical protein AWU57_608 [Marinobacter sp. T13-3]